MSEIMELRRRVEQLVLKNVKLRRQLEELQNVISDFACNECQEKPDICECDCLVPQLRQVLAALPVEEADTSEA